MTSTTVYAIIHENGTHTTLTRELQPDDSHVARAAATLASQGRKGFLARVEGDLRTGGTVTFLKDINAPTAGREAAKKEFMRRQGASRSRTEVDD